MLKYLSSAVVLSCGFDSSAAGDIDTPVCGLQLHTDPFHSQQKMFVFFLLIQS